MKVFTDSKDETDAIEISQTIDKSSVGVLKSMARDVLGDESYKKLTKIIRK